MTWYPRIQAAIKTSLAFLAQTQATTLALLVSALLIRQTLCLSELARAYPHPPVGRVTVPKHGLLHRLKRLWRFLNNERVDPLAVQVALVPSTVARLGSPRWLGLAIDGTMFETKLPTGQRLRSQVLRIAVPRRGRAVPLLQLAYNRDALPVGQSQNQLEEAALLAVVQALPAGVRPVILADRGLARAPFLEWLQSQHLDYVVRVNRGTCLTDEQGHRCTLGEAGLLLGQQRWLPAVRFGLSHDRPRALTLTMALSWRLPRHRARSPGHHEPDEPWSSFNEPPDHPASGGVVPAALGDRSEFEGPYKPLSAPIRASSQTRPPLTPAHGVNHCPVLARLPGVRPTRRVLAPATSGDSPLGPRQFRLPRLGVPRYLAGLAALLPAQLPITRWVCVSFARPLTKG